MVKIKWFKRKT